MAAEVDAHAFVIDHHVHATIVAVAGGRLTFTILINYFAAKVTAVDVGSLCPDRKRHQAKQHGCKNHYFLHFSTQLERDGHRVQHAHQLATTHGWFPAGQRFDNAHGLVLQQSFSLLTHRVLVYLGVFAELLV